MHGRPDFLDQAIRCAKKFNIRHEILETSDIRKRYPQFAVTDERAYFEYETGFLRPEFCLQAKLDLARKHGAAVQSDEFVMSFETDGPSAVTVTSSRGVYFAENVDRLRRPLDRQFLTTPCAHLFTVYRQVMYWFDIREDYRSTFASPGFPIFIWILGTGGEFSFYGFPTLDGKTIKIATEQFTAISDPDHVQRSVSRKEEQAMYKDYVECRLPGISDRCSAAGSRLYTVTPDSNFVIDVHPDDDRIIIASPCSGHGFKHSAAIGRGVGRASYRWKSKIDMSSFSLKRFKDPIL